MLAACLILGYNRLMKKNTSKLYYFGWTTQISFPSQSRSRGKQKMFTHWMDCCFFFRKFITWSEKASLESRMEIWCPTDCAGVTSTPSPSLTVVLATATAIEEDIARNGRVIILSSITAHKRQLKGTACYMKTKKWMNKQTNKPYEWMNSIHFSKKITN